MKHKKRIFKLNILHFMIFIPTMEIATRIMTLIDNAKKELILVSPYISIDNWQKLKKCLQRAVDRDVNITIYARENANQNLETIKSFKLNLYLVKDLHAIKHSHSFDLHCF